MVAAETTKIRKDPVLSVNNLRTYFPTMEGVVQAVDGVSFEIRPGETLGVVGESGCGKSTLGRTLLQILDNPGRIESGSVIWRRDDGEGNVNEIDIAKLAPDSRAMRSIRGDEIALVFQEPMTAFSPVHTIGNQLNEAIVLHTDIPYKEAGERARELLDMVGIPNPEQRLKEHAWQLSGGLRQRAMIAMALACDPKLLIADEPTTALDVTTQAQILALLRRLQEENGMAILLITHNLGVIAEMADEVVVMYLGKAVESGPVEDVFYSPQHPYTQGLLRSIPSIYAKGVERLPSISGWIPHPFNRPSGCTFRPRCPSFMEGICDRHEPEFQPLEGTQQTVSCFLHHPPQEVAERG
jgi:peptide/nickel transport system ATP-binding protein